MELSLEQLWSQDYQDLPKLQELPAMPTMAINITKSPEASTSFPNTIHTLDEEMIRAAKEAADNAHERYPEFDPAFLHVLLEVVNLPQTSVIYHQTEVFEILDLITMSHEDIQDIRSTDNVQISKCDARLLIQFTW